MQRVSSERDEPVDDGETLQQPSTVAFWSRACLLLAGLIGDGCLVVMFRWLARREAAAPKEVDALGLSVAYVGGWLVEEISVH